MSTIMRCHHPKPADWWKDGRFVALDESQEIGSHGTVLCQIVRSFEDPSSAHRGTGRSTWLGAGVLLLTGFSPGGMAGSCQVSLQGSMNLKQSLVPTTEEVGRVERSGVNSMVIDHGRTGISSKMCIEKLSSDATTTEEHFTESMVSAGQEDGVCTTTSLAADIENLSEFQSINFTECLKKINGNTRNDINVFENMNKNIICVYQSDRQLHYQPKTGEHDGVFYWKVPLTLRAQENPKATKTRHYCFAFNGSTTPQDFHLFWTRQRTVTNDEQVKMAQHLKKLKGAEVEKIVRQFTSPEQRAQIKITFVAFETFSDNDDMDAELWTWNGQVVRRLSTEEVDKIVNRSGGARIWKKDIGKSSITILAMPQLPAQLDGQIVQELVGTELCNIIGRTPED